MSLSGRGDFLFKGGMTVRSASGVIDPNDGEFLFSGSMSIRSVTPEFVAKAETEAALPSTGLQTGDWAAIEKPEGEAGFYGAARTSGGTWAVGEEEQRGVSAWPAATGNRVELGDATYPIRYWDGTTTRFSVDNAGNVVIIGTLKTGGSGQRWHIGVDQPYILSGYTTTLSNPADVEVAASGASIGYLRLRPPYGGAWALPQLQLEVSSTTSAITAKATEFVPEVDEIRLASGRQARGYCAHRSPAIGAAGAVWGNGVTYGGVGKLTNVPSSITFTTVGTDANVTSVAAADIDARGFRFEVTQNAANTITDASRTYVTVGA